MTQTQIAPKGWTSVEAGHEILPIKFKDFSLTLLALMLIFIELADMEDL